MIRLKKNLRTAASVLAVGGLLLGAAAIEDVPEDTKPVAVKYAGDELITNADLCQEDEPCWDCDTMGNQICGETMGPPMNTYLDAYNWCDAEFGDESKEAIDCQIAALEAWYPEALTDAS